jgi:hypothetical protein
MSKIDLKQEIDKLLTVKADELIILRFQDEYCKINKSGMQTVKANPDAVDFTDRCEDLKHFQSLCKHVCARIRNDKSDPDYGFVWVREVQDQKAPGTIYIHH